MKDHHGWRRIASCPMTDHIRNIAIIAHVDHGKTTLVDELLKAGGVVEAHQQLEERAMDSMDLEREKGITIKAKNTAVKWRENTINIVDTPGHADFGGEVERVMRMVDGVLLVVDAFEGPQAQTRFVLRKALAEGLLPILVINKIDREAADPLAVQDRVLELLLELGATEDQFEAPVLYGSAKEGYFVADLADQKRDSVEPLIEVILERVPPPQVDAGAPFRMLVSNIDWDDYVGRVALGRVESGEVRKGDALWLLRRDGSTVRSTITKVFEYAKLGTQDAAVGEAGNIVGLAGFEDVDIGETLAASEQAEVLPFVAIDPPTVQMQFAVNDGPFAGRDGRNVTSRAIWDRLQREVKTNVSIEVSESGRAGIFNVSARGAMQIAVLVETMRREDYEVLVSRPTVITRREEGVEMEPFETLYLELPADMTGGVIQTLANRKGVVEVMEPRGTMSYLEVTIPTRGLIGFEFELMNLTSGHGVMSHLFKDYRQVVGKIRSREQGSLVSMSTGTAMAYSLESLEERGRLFVEPTDEVYEGQIVGENARSGDLPVNPTKAKNLTNHRSATKSIDEGLRPAIKMSLERAIEYIEPDEFVEATPSRIRLRKRILCPHERKRSEKTG
ncbi:MAG: translational GTPase TypA [Roseibacillus sp.]|nr:translational GTPase TypA [Roseibacillus sp.]MDP7497462.1 translational GTPase TypA [Roseibacillus sp.]MDP7654945.1 translational GTPase TypA [Roseibacillus sp.]HJM63773.1 translational GTPase TypA [Roseibacillus sp.]